MRARTKRPTNIADDLLVDLARHPGFEILKARMLEHQRREMETLGAFLLRNPNQLDPLVLERKRGFFSGQRWFLRAVDNELAVYNRQPVPDDPEDTTE